MLYLPRRRDHWITLLREKDGERNLRFFDWQRIKETYPLAENVTFYKVVGGIEETIVELADKISCDIIVVGPYYKKPKRLFSTKMRPGLADTLNNKVLHPILPCPLMIAP